MEPTIPKEVQDQQDRLTAGLSTVAARNIAQNLVDFLATGQPITRTIVANFDTLLQNVRDAVDAIERLRID